jgi:hypothetical protein
MTKARNHHSGGVTFTLQMDVVGDRDEVGEWIRSRSVETVVASNESGTRGFQWFLREDSSKAVLIERFDDSDAAKERVENLFADPVAGEWQERFTPTSFLVCGPVKNDLIELLEPMNPEFYEFAGGFVDTRV